MEKVVQRHRLIESKPHEFTAEASDLGWPPGQWPDKVVVPGLGNGQPFIIEELAPCGASYRQDLGCVTLRIWND